MKRDRKYKTSTFHAMAMELCDEAIEDSKLASRDMTDIFWKELEEMCKQDELRRIQLNAPVRMGKSTTAIALGVEMYEHKKKYKGATGEFNIKNIARDQQEFAQMIRDPKLVNTVKVVDEYNSAQDTGENSTVEKALQDTYSDVQAGRYIDEVRCQPTGLGDKNIQIMLECQSKGYDDELKEFNHCYLYWRFFKGNVEYVQLLGHVNISVHKVIKNWLKVKDIFFKFHKMTDEDKKIIAKYRKKDFYVEYMIKKYEKMDIMTKEGIFNERELDYAEAIWEVSQNLIPLVKISTQKNEIVNKDIITNFVRKVCSDMRIPLSMFGRAIIVDRVNGILSNYRSHKQLKRTIEIRENKFFSEFPHLIDSTAKGLREHKAHLENTDPENAQLRGIDFDIALLEGFEKDIEVLKDGEKQLGLAIDIQEGELKRLIEIKERYHKFETSTEIA